jgi:hypothetical protein
MRLFIPLVLLCAALPCGASRAQDADQLAKQLQNPLAALTSVPLQLNYERGAGVDRDADGTRLNVQPVIPKDIGDDWNLISRTILPVVSSDELYPGMGSQSGFGDLTQSLFFSPEAASRRGWTWGVGPALLAPTATDDSLGAGRWALGPTFVALKQTSSGWTYGGLFNHLASFAGDDGRDDVRATLVQIFGAKRIGPGRTVSATVESTYDWEHEQWTVPVNIAVAQVMRIGKQMVSFQVGGGRYAAGPELAPDWGLRLTTTLLFPKR